MFSTSSSSSSSGVPLSIRYPCVKWCQCTGPSCAKYHICTDKLLDERSQPSVSIRSPLVSDILKACRDIQVLAFHYVSGLFNAHCGIAGASYLYYILSSTCFFGLPLMVTTFFCLQHLLHKFGRLQELRSLQQRRYTPGPDVLLVAAVALGLVEICLGASFDLDAKIGIAKTPRAIALATISLSIGLTVDGFAQVGEVVVL